MDMKCPCIVTGSVSVQSDLSAPVRNVSASVSLRAEDNTLLLNINAPGVVVNLPALAGLPDGKSFTIWGRGSTTDTADVLDSEGGLVSKVAPQTLLRVTATANGWQANEWAAPARPSLQKVPFTAGNWVYGEFEGTEYWTVTVAATLGPIVALYRGVQAFGREFVAYGALTVKIAAADFPGPFDGFVLIAY